MTTTEADATDPITMFGTPVLHSVCEPAVPGPEMHDLVDRMFAAMHANQGVGLAANQIGVGLRVFVVDCPNDDHERVVAHVLNPVFVDHDEPRVLDDGTEGCLSVPGPHAVVARPDYAVVEGVDYDGNPVRIVGTGLLARCLQHEMDHLDGRVYVERLNSKERKRVLKEAGFVD